MKKFYLIEYASAYSMPKEAKEQLKTFERVTKGASEKVVRYLLNNIFTDLIFFECNEKRFEIECNLTICTLSGNKLKYKFWQDGSTKEVLVLEF
jgi:hypothetical protein